MEMITLTINGQTVQAPKNATILEAARSAGIHIPTLCYHSELAPEGACRLCVVEATGGFKADSGQISGTHQTGSACTSSNRSCGYLCKK